MKRFFFQLYFKSDLSYDELEERVFECEALNDTLFGQRDEEFFLDYARTGESYAATWARAATELERELGIRDARVECTPSMFEFGATQRGFHHITFKDRYEEQCSIQKSSLATESAIWLGIDKPVPKIMASQTPEGGTGWKDVPLPEGTLLSGRMHLTRRMVAEMLPILEYFVENGELPSEEI